MRRTSHTQPTLDSRWMSIDDFRLQFGISKATQARLRKTGNLPYSKIGKVVRYDRLLIDKYFEDHRVA